ncbi:MAG: magnesium transporter accessory protein, partial [Phycisphaerales bacterium]|nr:magnesium transporter accessory protein [Phycisphaerales bacterium]
SGGGGQAGVAGDAAAGRDGLDADNAAAAATALKLASPVSLVRVAKFGLIFLALSAAGTLAQRLVGSAGFLAVAVAGGMISSASTTASAAALATAGTIGPATAAVAAVLTSMASSLVSVPLVLQQTRRPDVARRLAVGTALAAAVGLLVLAAGWWAWPYGGW